MISRLTAAAAVFAVLATSTLAWAATTQARRTANEAACDVTVVHLPTVQVTGKRATAAPTLAQR